MWVPSDYEIERATCGTNTVSISQVLHTFDTVCGL